MICLFANNAVTTIASPINAQATEVQVAAGTGALFPNPVEGKQFFLMTFVDALTGLVNEIVQVTARNGDVMTIVRAQENTAAVAWLAGDGANNFTTAGTQSNFSQIQQAQSDEWNYTKDTGTANSYVAALTPAVTERVEGLYARIKAANTNTGPSTLNLGAGSFPIINPDGSDLGANAIVEGGIFEVVDDGVTGYQLISASQEAQSTAGIATTGAITWRPTNETVAGWVFANATTIGDSDSGATQLADPTAENLFEWHWLNFSNTQCPVFLPNGTQTTRGISPAADWTANKAIRVVDLRGAAPLGMDNMGGHASTYYNGVPAASGNAETPGSIIGEVFHTLTAAEAPTITGVNTNEPSYGLNIAGAVQAPTAASTASTGGGAFPFNEFNNPTAQPVSFSQASVTITPDTIAFESNNTGNGAHNTVDRGMVGTFYIKL